MHTELAILAMADESLHRRMRSVLLASVCPSDSLVWVLVTCKGQYLLNPKWKEHEEMSPAHIENEMRINFEEGWPQGRKRRHLSPSKETPDTSEPCARPWDPFPPYIFLSCFPVLMYVHNACTWCPSEKKVLNPPECELHSPVGPLHEDPRGTSPDLFLLP